MLNPVCKHHEQGVKQLLTRKQLYYLCPDCLIKVINNILNHADYEGSNLMYALIEEVIADKEKTSEQVLIKQLTWIAEPDETGYWYVKFPDGSIRMTKVEEAICDIDDIQFSAIDFDYDNMEYYISQTNEDYDHYKGCEWLKVSPQL